MSLCKYWQLICLHAQVCATCIIWHFQEKYDCHHALYFVLYTMRCGYFSCKSWGREAWGAPAAAFRPLDSMIS